MTDSNERWRTTTRRSALGLMSVGAAFFATETLGFTQLSADRGVNVAVADDLNAALIIEAANDSTDLGNSGEVLEDGDFTDNVFIRFENNTGDDDREITLGDDDGEISGDDADNITVSDKTNDDLNVSGRNFGFTLTDNEDFVEIEVAEDDSSEDKLDLTLELNNVDIGGATVTLTRDFEIDVTANQS